MSTLVTTSSVLSTSSVFSKEIDGVTYLLRSKSDEYIELNETAAFVWKLVEQHASVAQVIAKLAKTYSLDTAQAEADCLDLLNQLHDEKLITVA